MKKNWKKIRYIYRSVRTKRPTLLMGLKISSLDAWARKSGTEEVWQFDNFLTKLQLGMQQQNKSWLMKKTMTISIMMIAFFFITYHAFDWCWIKKQNGLGSFDFVVGKLRGVFVLQTSLRLTVDTKLVCCMYWCKKSWI